MQHSALGLPGVQPLGGPFPLDTQHLPPWQSRPKTLLQQSACTLQVPPSGLQQKPDGPHSYGASQQSQVSAQGVPGPPSQHSPERDGEQIPLQHSALTPPLQPLGGALPSLG